MKVVGFLAIVAVAVLLALGFAEHFKQDDRLSAARDTMRVIEYQRDTVRDTITVYVPRAAAAKAVSDSLDAKVAVVDDSTLHVQESPDSIHVPPIVIADIRALRLTVATQDTLIGWLQRDRRLDSLWHIQDAKLPHKPESPWGLGATCGFVTSGGPGCAVGVTYRVKLPKMSLPFR